MFLYLTFRGLDFGRVIECIGSMDKAYLALMFAMTFAAYVLRTVRWRVILKKIKYVKIFDLFKYLLSGFFINNVLPMRAGEFYRAYMLGTNMNFSRSSCLGSIVVERAFDGIIFLLIVVIALLVFPFPGFILTSIIAMLFFLLAVICFMFLSIRLKDFYKKMILKMPVKENLKKSMTEILDNFVTGLEMILSAPAVSQAVITSVGIWFMELMVAYSLTRAFGFELGFHHITFLVVLLGIGVMVPFTPGYVGTFEFAGKTALELLGVESNSAVSFVIVLHTFQILFVTVFGLPSLLSTQFKWRYLNKE